MRCLFLLCGLGFSTYINAQIHCRVLDPELQKTYQGACVNGLAEGSGSASGSAIYRGHFKAGQKHGAGTKYWPASGDRYTGEFAHDQKHGYGRYEWGANSAWYGEVYEGQYVNDQRHGVGTYFWPFGDRYTGLWEADIQASAATPGQEQRFRAEQSLSKVIGIPGAYICRQTRNSRQNMQWEIAYIQQLQDGRVLAQPLQVEQRLVSKPATWQLLIEWQPCNPDLLLKSPGLNLPADLAAQKIRY